jgi:hypothetical protein
MPAKGTAYDCSCTYKQRRPYCILIGVAIGTAILGTGAYILWGNSRDVCCNEVTPVIPIVPPVATNQLTFTFQDTQGNGNWTGVLTDPLGNVFTTQILLPFGIQSIVQGPPAISGLYTMQFVAALDFPLPVILGTVTITSNGGSSTFFATPPATYVAGESTIFTFQYNPLLFP